MGALSVVASAVIAAVFLHERLNVLGQLGAALCLVGTTLIVIFAPQTTAVSRMIDLAYRVINPGAPALTPPRPDPVSAHTPPVYTLLPRRARRCLPHVCASPHEAARLLVEMLKHEHSRYLIPLQLRLIRADSAASQVT